MSVGDPHGYGEMLDETVPDINLALVAELEQAVAHWRAAGWSDLAIGAVVVAGQAFYGHRLHLVQALRRVM